MTDEQINTAIAQACGWTECRLVAKVVLSVLRAPVAYGIPPNGTYEIACPNYCNDLNAMHEAESLMEHGDLLFEYGMHISISHRFEHLLRATARQRAEAFLRTLGKWEEAE
jgi:hypothetical protein